MTLDEADKIVRIWGIYLEHFWGKLNIAFMARIPYSFLPFPIKTLEEAINIIAEYYYEQDDKKTMEAIQASIGCLTGFTDDDEAFLNAAKMFNDHKWRKEIIASLNKLQKQV